MNMILKNIFKYILPNKLVISLLPYIYIYQLYLSKIKYYLVGIKKDPYDIPIIINNLNRLSYLKELIKSLHNRGYYNIHILDNNSTYPPLLEFYKLTNINVIYLKKNYGFKAVWESGVVKQFWHSYYVYTDADLRIDDKCPNDFMEHFLNLLDKYKNCYKVGFGLRIDDLPDYFKNKEDVIQHESKFWIKSVENDVYEAPIDTTFALYRPFTGSACNLFQQNLRTGGAYVMQHLPWYIDSSNLSEEERYYVNNVLTPTHWSEKNQNKN